MAKKVNKAASKSAPDKRRLFLAFDPSVYSEREGYTTNPAFNAANTRPLRTLADRALRCISKATPGYEDRLTESHAYKTTKMKGREKQQGKVLMMDFSPTLFDVEPDSCLAVRISYSDFENAAALCLDLIGDNKWQSSAEALDRALLDEYYRDNGTYYTSKDQGITYHRKHLLGFFALWNIDLAIQAINAGKAREVAQYLMEAVVLVEQSERIFAEKITSLNSLKKKSEQQAQARKKGHEKNEPLIQKHIDMFTSKKGKNGRKPWKSIEHAISIVRPHFKDQVSKEALRRRFQQADPHGYLTEYKRKKSV